MSKIELIDLKGLGPATVEKLNTAGFHDVMSIAVATPSEIVEASGMALLTVKKLIAQARDSLEMGFIDGEEMQEQEKNKIRLTSGSTELDKLLGGGFESGVITELSGAWGCGKTNMCHQLAVNVQLPASKGGADGVCVYINTESSASPDRIVQMAQALGLDVKQTLKNVKFGKAFNFDHQSLMVEKINDLIKQGVNVKLVIVDSIIAHLRAEYQAISTLATRQQHLNKHLRSLNKLASLNNICIIITNQVMTNPGQFFGDPIQPVGGNVLGHSATVRIYLRKGKKGTRVAKLIDHPSRADGECVFQVLTDGIRDVTTSKDAKQGDDE